MTHWIVRFRVDTFHNYSLPSLENLRLVGYLMDEAGQLTDSRLIESMQSASDRTQV